ncbi:MAG: site-2 protease family protein [Candidatus Bathyarchaeota archaeon]
MAVGLTYFLSITSSSTSVLLGLTIAFTFSFLLHEIAHKFSAQHFNMWAEFRLTLQGALLTLLSAFLPPPFKIISPGAVMIAGSGTQESIGKVAVSGPITNIGLSAGCALIAMVSNQNLFWFVAFLNAFLATFNMIPFGVIDGLKVYKWNKIAWAVVFVLAIVLMALTYGSTMSVLSRI